MISYLFSIPDVAGCSLKFTIWDVSAILSAYCLVASRARLEFRRKTNGAVSWLTWCAQRIRGSAKRHKPTCISFAMSESDATVKKYFGCFSNSIIICVRGEINLATNFACPPATSTSKKRFQRLNPEFVYWISTTTVYNIIIIIIWYIDGWDKKYKESI